MLVMLYCNLFTGPSLVFLTAFLLWYFLPFSNYILLIYIGVSLVLDLPAAYPVLVRVGYLRQ